MTLAVRSSSSLQDRSEIVRLPALLYRSPLFPDTFATLSRFRSSEIAANPIESTASALFSHFCPSERPANLSESVASTHSCREPLRRVQLTTGGKERTFVLPFASRDGCLAAFARHSPGRRGGSLTPRALTPMESYRLDALWRKSHGMISFQKTPGGGGAEDLLSSRRSPLVYAERLARR